jgi:tetratricopeptide (TPR) repeat protein
LTIGREFGIHQVNKIRGMYFVHLGDEAYREHRMQDAIDAYKTGLEMFPEHYEAWLNLGNIYVVYEDYFSATEAYQNAIMAKNNYTSARMNLGIITAEKLGDFDGAISQYKSIVASKHRTIAIPFVFDNKKSETANRAIAYYNMGRAYSQKAFYLPKDKVNEKRELLGKAANSYEKAVEIISDNYDMNYNLALTYHLLGDYRKAGQYYCKAIDTEPMNYEAHYNLGLMLRHLHEDTYSIDELEKAAVLSTTKANSNSKYIFDILSAVSMNALQKGIKGNVNDLINEQIAKVNNENSDKIKKESEKKKTDQSSKAKVSASDTSEDEIVENFRTCNSKFLFDTK